MKKEVVLGIVMLLWIAVNVHAVSVTTAIGSGADTYLTNDSKNKSPAKNGTSSMIEIRYLNPATSTRVRIAYLRFDISSIPVDQRSGAILSVQDYGGTPKSGQVWNIYGLKDGTDDSWDESNINYLSAPGMLTPPEGNDLGFYAIDATKLKKVGVIKTQLAAAGIETSNVVDLYMDGFIKEDTNNLVTFVIVPASTHASADWYISSKERVATGVVFPTLTFTPDPGKAKNPSPAWNVTVNPALTTLSWTNPEPNQPGGQITCDVYRGTTEPNYLLPNYGYTTIAAGTGATTVTMPALEQFKTYYWFVDCHDTTRHEVTKGYRWTFNTLNQAPDVKAGPDKYPWLVSGTISVDLVPTSVTDDGLPSNTLTYQWTLTSGDPNGVQTLPANTKDVTLTFTRTGIYVLRLTANDSVLTGYDDVQVVVSATPCDAAKAVPGYTPYPGDINGDCYVSLADFVLMAQNWLRCSSLAPCN